jgi:glutamyl endopeptidase
MGAPGHRPVSNRDTETPTRAPAARLEAATLEGGRVKRLSLPYYKPPRRRTERLLEAAVLDGESAAAPAIPLRDVAVASFGDTLILEAVIGTDDRVQVSNDLMNANPWRQICALRITSKTNQVYVGTGWFIGPRMLATAGHCVFLQDEGGWAKSIDVVPAKHGPVEPFKVRSTHYNAVDGWTHDRSRDFDYGVIRLDDAGPGTALGNFTVESLEDGQLVGVEAKISGYPADRLNAQFQFFHERPVKSVTDTRLNYDIDTFGGQSGSPIWQEGSDGFPVAVGIHTTGGVSSNSGTRINNDVLDNLLRWLQE